MMPLKNDEKQEWRGWLVDGLGGREDEFQNILATTIESRAIPKCTVETGTVNMWWRKDSRYIDASSNLDGKITSTIHVQPYGTSLWVGRAVESRSAWTWNYYKRMAASAFIKTIDRCIRSAILTLVDESALHSVSDFRRERD